MPVTPGIDTLVLGGNTNQFILMRTCLNLAIGTSGEEQLMTAHDTCTGSTKVQQMPWASANKRGRSPLASPADVDTVIADGRIVKRAGQLIGVDLASLRAQATAGAQHMLHR